MKLTVLSTPRRGPGDRLFADSARSRRQVQEPGRPRLFRQRGYREVSTPADGSSRPVCPLGQCHSPGANGDRCSTEAGSSASCGLTPPPPSPGWRPPSCAPLPLPQRLYYDQTVYRAGPAHSGGSRELPQCGVELIGAAGMKADLEMVATAVDALRACGAARFHVELGHAGFFRDAGRPDGAGGGGDGADARP